MCTPAGSLALWPDRIGICACGEVVHLVRTAPTVNDWAEETLEGVRYVDRAPALLRADPARFWQELAEKKIGAYSNLKAATQLGHWSWFHHHRAVRWAEGPMPFEPPTCHNQPMWASPDGWQCRTMRRLFIYQEERREDHE